MIYLNTKDIIRIFAELNYEDPMQVFNLFEEFELTDIYDKKIHHLSLGQQKMLANLLAISFSPRLILLDEPFESLDQYRKMKFANYLNTIQTEILMITHEFSVLYKMPNFSLYFMLDGKLWGKFQTHQLSNLYISKGIVDGALSVIETKFGNYSVTQDHGDIAISRVSNLNSLMDMV